MSNKLEKNHWHPGFIGAMELEFKRYRRDLDFDNEHQLSKEPLKMDLLIIKKKKGTRIANQIGEIFRQHNVFEFKSPDDGLTIDDYIKTVGYAYLYKGLGHTVNEIPLSELTVTLVRDVIPEGFFEAVEAEGGKVEETYPGVYYITGVVNIPSQFVLTSSLDNNLHTALRLLTKKAKEEDVVKFIEIAKDLSEPGDKHNADAVLQVSVSANSEVYENVKRRNPLMCEALRELMKDEIQEEKDAAVKAATEAATKAATKATKDKTRLDSIKSLMKKMKWTAKQAMDALSISASDQKRYSSML